CRRPPDRRDRVDAAHLARTAGAERIERDRAGPRRQRTARRVRQRHADRARRGGDRRRPLRRAHDRT
ncbi:hypothetical protein LTR94_038264, partial [Friedmanniomyces endolithicus]